MRPLFVLTALATSMVAWFVVRMLATHSYDVWLVSCLLGAWAPLTSAAAFLYISDAGEREDSVLAAWLVRAIGMHFVLAWLLGVSDWLRGPPGSARVYNADAIAPFVLLSFVPVFLVCLTAFRWVLSVRRRLAAAEPLTSRTVTPEHAPMPYRGAARMHITERIALPALALPAALGAGAAALWLALALHLSPALALGSAALLLALASTLGASAVVPSLGALACVAAAVLARDVTVVTHDSLRLVWAWPWLALGGVAVYLSALEARLRLAPSR